MATKWPPPTQPGKMQTRLLKKGWLDINYTDCLPGTDKWNKANCKSRYCVLQHCDGGLSLKVYDNDKKAGSPHTLRLDTALYAAKCSTRYEVVTMDGGTLCVMDGTDDVMTDWVVSLNRAIMAARCQGNSDSDGDDISLEQGLAALSTDDSKKEFLEAWFPELHKKSYMIPRVHYGTPVRGYDQIVGGIKVTRMQTDEDIKQHNSDQNQDAHHVMAIVDVLKQVHDIMNTIKETIASSDRMVIMTEVKCSLYKSIYDGATDWNNNNNNNMEKGGAANMTWDMKHGFADLLVIHRDRGLLLGAVIGNTGADVGALCNDIKNALDYLDQAEAVVKGFILPGVAGGSEVAVNKTILLPNLERANLQRTDSLPREVRERLERCVGVQSGLDVTRWCLTMDDMADKKRLKVWWTACLRHDTQGDTTRMAEEVYRALVARFAVPLTTVEMSLSTQPRLQLWTAGHVVHAVGEEHGRDLTRIALFPRQVDLLEDTPDDDDDDDVRILHGGPGTAKTILLLLRGVSWSRDGCDRVFNIQTEDDGQAAAYLVSHQLRETVARARPGDTVARPDFTVQHVNMTPWWDWRNGDWKEEYRKAVAAWYDDAARSEDKKVHIIADEADGHIISHLYTGLKDRGCTVKLWAAGVLLMIPDAMQRYVKQITAPLRCPPCVVREVERANVMKDGTVPRYTKPPVAPPCDGPPVITITHYRELMDCGDREGHWAERDDDVPWQCEECGRRVAHLLHTLHHGRPDNGPGEQGGLRYNDVFIMGDDFDCNYTPDEYNKSPAPFIRGLRQLGIPTRVVHHKDSEAVRRVAENSWTGVAVADAVTIVEERTVWGLERKVVVFLDQGYGVANKTGRLHSMSRSTSQVIWVKPED